MIKKLLNGKLKMAGDLFYTMMATVVMQIALHIIIYPLITKFYGAAVTGDILYFIGIVYILPQAVGTAINNTRLVTRKTTETTNGDFTAILVVAGSMTGLISFFIGYEGANDIAFSIMFAIFAIVYMIRIYAQVEFRLTLNFKGYFIYYAIVSVGYIVGFGIYVLTHVWLTIFFTGELLALAYSFRFGNIFKIEKAAGKSRHLYKTMGMVLFSMLVRDGVNQFDKVFLKLLISPESVTYYNALSLVGKSIQMLVSPVNTLMLSYLSAKDSKLTMAVFKRFILLSTGIGVIALVGCQIVTPIYIGVFYHGFYESVIGLSLIVNSGLIMGFIASLFMAIILSQGKANMYAAIQTVWGICYTVPAYFITSRYGIIGLASVTLVVNSIKCLVAAMLAGIVISKSEKGCREEIVEE